MTRFSVSTASTATVDADQLIGRILLRHNAIRVVVTVLVADGIAELGRARVVAVARHRFQPLADSVSAYACCGVVTARTSSPMSK